MSFELINIKHVWGASMTPVTILIVTLYAKLWHVPDFIISAYYYVLYKTRAVFTAFFLCRCPETKNDILRRLHRQ